MPTIREVFSVGVDSVPPKFTQFWGYSYSTPEIRTCQDLVDLYRSPYCTFNLNLVVVLSKVLICARTSVRDSILARVTMLAYFSSPSHHILYPCLSSIKFLVNSKDDSDENYKDTRWPSRDHFFLYFCKSNVVDNNTGCHVQRCKQRGGRYIEVGNVFNLTYRENCYGSLYGDSNSINTNPFINSRIYSLEISPGL